MHRLKQQGYRRVVVVDQSFGAFLSLTGADDSDEVDPVIATAPAAYGTYADHYDTGAPTRPNSIRCLRECSVRA